MRHTFLVVTVKRRLKSVYIYGSYRKSKTGVPFFWTTLYNAEHVAGVMTMQIKHEKMLLPTRYAAVRPVAKRLRRRQ